MVTESDRSFWIIDWLSRQGPAEWHGYIERHDWDGGSTEPLEWIIAQPACDAATAATIFWLSQPDYYLDGTHDDHEIARLDLAIIKRWSGDGFRTRRFAWDEGFPDHIDRINAGSHIVPASIAEPIHGTDVFPWFDELPPEIDIAWHRANGRDPPRHLLAADKALPRYVGERPGRLTGEESAKVWAAIGSTSVFTRLSAADSSNEDSTRHRIRDLRSASKIDDLSAITPATGLIGKLTRWFRSRR